MFDFYRGSVTINYNRIFKGGAYSVQQYELGWSEEYLLPLTPGVGATRQNMKNLVAARASLLPRNCYIFEAGFHQASVYRSMYDLNGYAKRGTWDNQEIASQIIEYCQDVDDGIQYRLEDGNGRRWNRLIRAIRDSWIFDMASVYGSYTYDPVPAATTIQVATTGGVQATGTATVLGGTLTGGAVTLGGGPYASPPSVAILGSNQTGSLNAVLTGGVVTAINVVAGGTGYSVAPTLWLAAPQSEPWGLMAGQAPATLLQNFIACLANYTINFKSIRTANAAFPSGYMTQGDTVPSGGTSGYVATRALFQKIGNRQSGRIRVSSPARKKRPI